MVSHQVPQLPSMLGWGTWLVVWLLGVAANTGPALLSLLRSAANKYEINFKQICEWMVMMSLVVRSLQQAFGFSEPTIWTRLDCFDLGAGWCAKKQQHTNGIILIITNTTRLLSAIYIEVERCGVRCSLFGGRSAAAQVRVVKGHLPASLLPGFGQLGAAYWALNGHPVLACCVVNWYFPTLTE